MPRLWRWIGVIAVVTLSLGIAYASGPIGIYALIDKVVFEPDTNRPERIQVSGVFVFASPGSPNSFVAPERGYLYYKRSEDDLQTLLEWTNLKYAAGTGQVVGFGGVKKLQVRKSEQRPENPDSYVRNFGVVTLRSDTDFPPVKALLEFHGRVSGEPGAAKIPWPR